MQEQCRYDPMSKKTETLYMECAGKSQEECTLNYSAKEKAVGSVRAEGTAQARWDFIYTS